jgi:hypothetical protein
MATSGVCLVVLRPHALAFHHAPREVCRFLTESLHRCVKTHALGCVNANQPNTFAGVEAEIIKQRYGNALTRYPFSRMEEFRQLEREAREQRRALWSSP